MRKNSPDNTTCIAVPYYGSLSVLPSRLTRIFFLVQVDMGTRTISDLTLEVWNPEKEPSLWTWLREMGTEGVICRDAYSQQRVALEEEGIWVQSQQEGEVHEVVERWLRDAPERDGKRRHNPQAVVRTPRTLKPAMKFVPREAGYHGNACKCLLQ